VWLSVASIHPASRGLQQWWVCRQVLHACLLGFMLVLTWQTKKTKKLIKLNIEE